MSEGWLPVVGYEGLYEVSSLGRVRSLLRYVATTNHWCKARILKQPVRKGYANVGLTNDSGHQKGWRVQRLVLLAFVGPPPNDEAILACHRNGDRADNAVNNLYWGTHKQNMADRAQHGTSYKGVRNSQAKLTLANVKDIRVQRASGVTLAVLAKKYRVTVGAISMAARGDTWEHVQ